MGLMIPGGLADLLNELGYIWPKSDETALFDLGAEWFSFGGDVAGFSADASAAAQLVSSANAGESVQAFLEFWNSEEGPMDVLASGAQGSMAVGGALIVCAVVVLALKINVIVQLTILAIEIIQAIATAVPTFGASLLEIPVFKKITDMLINLLISEAIEAVLG